MISWLESLPTVWAGIVIVGGFVLVSLALGLAVTKWTPADVRTAHNDRAGFILAVIGVIYAVLLAFVAIGVWDRFQQAEARTYDAAEAIATIYRDAGSFPNGAPLRAMLRAYVHTVIDDEWPRLQRGEKTTVSNPLLEAADRYVRGLPVNNARDADIQTQMLVAMDTVLRDRESRITIDSGGINGIMWLVLIVGAFVTVGFTYLFGFDRTLMQLLMVGGLSFLIGLVLFLVIAMDYPFRGSIYVPPDAFRALLETFNEIGR